MTFTQRCLIVTAAVTLVVTAVQASGATFHISAVGFDLGPPTDANAEIPKYKATIQEGDTLTLVADGVVLPRGGAPSPGTIDAGAWLFDDETFRLTPSERGKADKTKIVVALKALKPGTTHVRFVGDILGRYHKFDVLVEVTPK